MVVIVNSDLPHPPVCSAFPRREGSNKKGPIVSPLSLQPQVIARKDTAISHWHQPKAVLHFRTERVGRTLV